jgi:Rieske Fe-S protein
MSVNAQHERRQFLAQLVKFLLLIGLLAFAWVLVSSLTVTHQDEDESNQYYMDVDVSELKPGQVKKVSLQYKEVWIYHRSNDDIAQLKKQALPLRSVREQYFVFFPYEPKRGCVVNWDSAGKTFYDTCNARHFDLAGRVLPQTGLPTVQLSMPGYRFASDRLIQIDVRTANIR